MTVVNFNLIRATTVTTKNKKTIIRMSLMELDMNRIANKTQKWTLTWKVKIARLKTFE